MSPGGGDALGVVGLIVPSHERTASVEVFAVFFVYVINPAAHLERQPATAA